MHTPTLLTELKKSAKKNKYSYYTCSFGLEKQSFRLVMRNIGFQASAIHPFWPKYTIQLRESDCARVSDLHNYKCVRI